MVAFFNLSDAAGVVTADKDKSVFNSLRFLHSYLLYQSLKTAKVVTFLKSHYHLQNYPKLLV